MKRLVLIKIIECESFSFFHLICRRQHSYLLEWRLNKAWHDSITLNTRQATRWTLNTTLTHSYSTTEEHMLTAHSTVKLVMKILSEQHRMDNTHGFTLSTSHKVVYIWWKIENEEIRSSIEGYSYFFFLSLYFRASHHLLQLLLNVVNRSERGEGLTYCTQHTFTTDAMGGAGLVWCK